MNRKAMQSFFWKKEKALMGSVSSKVKRTIKEYLEDHYVCFTVTRERSTGKTLFVYEP